MNWRYVEVLRTYSQHEIGVVEPGVRGGEILGGFLEATDALGQNTALYFPLALSHSTPRNPPGPSQIYDVEVKMTGPLGK